MLTGLVVQYTLFLLVSLCTLSHTPRAITIESHIFNSSVTLLLATAYILMSYLLYYVYQIITHRSSNRNPDIELIYDNIQDDLRDMDPEADIEVCSTCREEGEEGGQRDRVREGSEGAKSSKPPVVHAVPKVLYTPPSVSPRIETEQRPEQHTDRVFFLEVYGYGLVMFIIYYSVDMMLLAPALSLLCGLMLLSVRDALQLLRDPASFPEQVVTSTFVTFISMLLLFVSIVEMFIASSASVDTSKLSEVATRSPIYVLLTYILPVIACLLMGAMDRSCSEHKKIRRAAPLAVMLSLFVVLWVLGVDIIVSERDYYKEAIKQIDSEWHSMYEVDTHPETDQPLLPAEEVEATNFNRRDIDLNQRNADWSDYSTSNESLFYDPGEFLNSAINPIRRNVPILSIILEPLLKLALTFSVITGIVNRKSTDTAAIVALLTAVKQMHFATSNFALDHLIRSIVISSSAALFCAARYMPTLWRCMQGPLRG